MDTTRFDVIKSRGLAKVHDVRDFAKSRVMTIQSSMREHPLRWAAIAAASGLGIGLIGRIVRTRRHRMPELILIEKSC